MRMFGQVDTSAFETLDHDLHRVRRAPWNPYFSKQSISRIQPLLIQTAVNKLCDRLADHQEAGKPVIMTNAYACLTTDIISEYAFPEGYDLLSRAEFDEEHYNAWIALSRVSHLMKQFGWLYPFLDSIPEWITKYTSPDFYVVIRQKKYLLEQAKLIIKRREKADYNDKTLRPSLLRSLLDSDLLPDSQKQPERIRAEAQVAMGAGTLTTSHGLKHATYFILADKDVHARLMAELKANIPDPDNPPVLRKLEQMPYLMAVMYETLRIFYGISHRLSRIFPDRSLQYNLGVFRPPERWLPLQTTGQHLLKYLAPFGGGSRQCVGMELGKAEILTALASVFRRFGDVMELWETRRDRDVDIAHDLFNPVSSREGNGVMVMFRKEYKTRKAS
ncbi:MAG: hypothetical protein Q9214_000141 [Letrouitia sp. 1 TL-2023]